MLLLFVGCGLLSLGAIVFLAQCLFAHCRLVSLGYLVAGQLVLRYGLRGDGVQVLRHAGCIGSAFV